MSTQTGGTAFPQNTAYLRSNGDIGHQGPQGGMTLRDYFAAKAMQGFVEARAWNPDFVHADESEAGRRADASVAKAAYMYADAMLAQRNNNKE